MKRNLYLRIAFLGALLSASLTGLPNSAFGLPEARRAEGLPPTVIDPPD